jgi:WD40 repeat protein
MMIRNSTKLLSINICDNCIILLLYFFAAVVLPFLYNENCRAVSSKIIRHATVADFSAGKADNVVIGSQGTLTLGHSAEVVADGFDDVWSINSIVVSGPDVFIGTSPNGAVYKLSLGKLTKIYPSPSQPRQAKPNSRPKTGAVEPNEPNTVPQEQYLVNEHIFAMAIDIAGRLLVGISGDKCALYRYQGDKMQSIFEPNDAKYIFAITVDDTGSIYLGTGPEGKIYKLDSFGKNPVLIYDSLDKNIISLAVGADNLLYAGTDGRGLIYKIDTKNKTAVVLYDAEQPEITALLFAGKDGLDLYAAAASADVVQTERKFVPQIPLAGRPETPQSSPEQPSEDKNRKTQSLQIANIGEKPQEQPEQEKPKPARPPRPTKAGFVYKISPQGYVTDVFTETAVFFALAEKNNKLILGTGNNGQTFSIDISTEEHAIIYEDESASQITAVAVADNHLLLGTANPPKLIKLLDAFASKGTFSSSLVDAGQPAKWGKLQIEADVPQDCKVLVASRSANVGDINDPTFSEWTAPVEVTEPVQLQCPTARFCQYKLFFHSADGNKTPLVKRVAVASTVPNLAPKVESVKAERDPSSAKAGVFKITYKAVDKNNDTLIYKVDFRKIGRNNWIELKDKLETDSYEWDTKTVEDGRYEIKVTASDERANTTETKLTGSRISDPLVVDNTPPEITEHAITKNGEKVTLILSVSDGLSAIGKVEYTVDSSTEWISALPDDQVYDTTKEQFTIVIEDVKSGEHVIALKFADDVANTAYKTFDLDMPARLCRPGEKE